MNQTLNKTVTEINDNTFLGMCLKHVDVGDTLFSTNMKKEIICGIYKITNPKGKIYIGQSVNIQQAWYHRYKNGFCKGQRLIYNSLRKYGYKNHIFEIILECKEEELNKWEIYYGKLFNCTDRKQGLNIRECGGSRGRHSEETKRRIGAANKRVYSAPEMKEAIRQRNLGKKASEESKLKMSLAHIGKKHKPESYIKMSIASTGRKFPNRIFTDEQRRKISEGNKGKYVSEETRKKLRKANTGKKVSEETKKKLSAIFKGKKRPQEIVEKRCKLILNIETGIFYIGARSVSEQMGVSELTASRRLNGYLINKTPFIYV